MYNFVCRFPLKNKLLLKKWIDNIKLHDWRKPLDCDRICSDHFEKDCVIINKNVYELKKNAIPLITPKVCFYKCVIQLLIDNIYCRMLLS